MKTFLLFLVFCVSSVWSQDEDGSPDSSAGAAGRRSQQSVPIPSSLAHMEFIYHCLAANLGLPVSGGQKRCQNYTHYSCASIIQGRAGNTTVYQEQKCLKLTRLDILGGAGQMRRPCFAEAWFSKAQLVSLGPEAETISSTKITIQTDGGEMVGHALVDLSTKALTREPWISIDLLSSAGGGQLWRSTSFRLCIVSEVEGSPLTRTIMDARLGGRKRPKLGKGQSPVTVDGEAFVVSGFTSMPALRLDEFLQGKRPDTSTSQRAERTRRSDSQPRLKVLIPDNALPVPTPPSSPPSDSPPMRNGLCNRTSLYISFSQLQPRNNVVRHPAGLHIFDCVGKCTETTEAASAHAFLMRSVRNLGRSGAQGSPMSTGCCIPTEFDPAPINLLVSDRNGMLTIFAITNPTVSKCGCT